MNVCMCNVCGDRAVKVPTVESLPDGRLAMYQVEFCKTCDTDVEMWCDQYGVSRGQLEATCRFVGVDLPK
jgi:hypothetical protein